MSQYNIPIGPYHPGIHEPEYFKVRVEGETVKEVDMKLGYNYRKIEELITKRTWDKAVYLIERICGICSTTHTLCFVTNMEKIGKIQVSERAKYIRMIVTEIERIQNHLLWFGTAANNIGFQTLFMESWKIRTRAMDLMEKICNARIFAGMNVPGGVRFDINNNTNLFVRKEIRKMIPQVQGLIREIDSNETIHSRWKHVGRLTMHHAKNLGVVGPTARAAGLYIDARKNQPYLAYPEINFQLIKERTGDCYARARVRLREVLESIHIITQCLEKMPKSPITWHKIIDLPEGRSANVKEAPRGEDFHYLESNGGKNPSFIRIRAPTYANLQAISEMCRNAQLGDVPVIINSIDPCFACCDRITVINENQEVSYVEMD